MALRGLGRASLWVFTMTIVGTGYFFFIEHDGDLLQHPRFYNVFRSPRRYHLRHSLQTNHHHHTHFTQSLLQRGIRF